MKRSDKRMGFIMQYLIKKTSWTL